MIPPTTPHPDDPVELHFAPQGRLAQLKFSLLGRPLIWGSLREAGRLPADLSVQQRFRVQQRFSRRLLRHLQVNLELRGLEHLGKART